MIKASRLAAGKGVILPESKAEALAALRAILVEQQFGEYGDGADDRGAFVRARCLCWPLTASRRIMPAAQDFGA